MDATIQSHLTNLIQGRRLLIMSSEIAAQRKHKSVKTKSAKESMEEDAALINGDVSAEKTYSATNIQAAPQKTSINLGDLSQRFKQAQSASSSVQVTISQSVEESMEIHLVDSSPVEGLVVRNKQLAETDRYRFEFANGSSLTILDKWSGKSTTVWGDPHVDVSDVQGQNDGDFKDLKNSNIQTTFMLKDGTRLTFTAEDSGIIQQVDIFKGSQHLTGIGAGSTKWNEADGLFATRIDENTSASVPVGDVVYAGGDGTDWYDSAGRLVWGKVTGPDVYNRPPSYLEINYQRRETQSIVVTQIDQMA